MTKTHIGYFRVVNKDTNEFIKRYHFDKVTAKERKQLRANPNIVMFCDCLEENDIELKVASNLVIYPAQKNSSDKHHLDCPKYKSVDAREWSWDSTKRAYRASSYNDAEKYMRKLNIELFYGSDFKDKYDGLKLLKRKARRILTSSGIYLSEFINPQKIENNKEYFIYMFLGKIEKSPNNKVKLICLDSSDTNSSTSILADRYTFDNFYLSNKYYTWGENKRPMLIGGWAYLDEETNEFTFSDFWMRPTDSSGRLFF